MGCGSCMDMDMEMEMDMDMDMAQLWIETYLAASVRSGPGSRLQQTNKYNSSSEFAVLVPKFFAIWRIVT